MRYGKIDRFQTGVAVPLGALRTEKSCGVGEFADLVPFAKWAKSCGMDLIQLLPVNDTGEERSPYSALSAFALHPVYVRLEDLPLSAPQRASVEAFAKVHADDSRIAWLDAVRFKRDILRRHYGNVIDSVEADADFAEWLQANPWVRPYAVFCRLKEKQGMRPWQAWTELRDPKPGEIDAAWEADRDETLFHAWVQWIAERQFSAAVAELEKAGVRLKGDVPILLSEDSADVWSGRGFFDLDNRAGAPPDMFCHAGQNWRFPSYRWDALERDDYSWWRARLRRASKFYHAYRIDHVLGFFRIWEVPERECTGMLGRFVPALPLRRADLLAAGLSSETIDRLLDPVFSDGDVAELLGPLGSDGTPWLKRVPGGWRIDRAVFSSERALFESNLPQELKDALVKLYWDRVLLSFDGEPGDFHPFWYWYDSRAFRSLDGDDAAKVRGLVDAYFARQQDFWAANGRKLLTMMVEETDMLVCAEDLGVVPDCVPATLADMGILGLKIERWMRDWEAPGQPWFPMEKYPRPTVCSSGTHDTSTLRGYWEEEGWPKEQYAREIGLGSCPDYLTEEAAEAVVRRNLRANSILAILPLQDWLSLSYGQRSATPAEERINVPGSLDATNWVWRMARPVSALAADEALISKIRTLVEERANRPLT